MASKRSPGQMRSFRANGGRRAPPPQSLMLLRRQCHQLSGSPARSAAMPATVTRGGISPSTCLPVTSSFDSPRRSSYPSARIRSAARRVDRSRGETAVAVRVRTPVSAAGFRETRQCLQLMRCLLPFPLSPAVSLASHQRQPAQYRPGDFDRRRKQRQQQRRTADLGIEWQSVGHDTVVADSG